MAERVETEARQPPRKGFSLIKDTIGGAVKYPLILAPFTLLLSFMPQIVKPPLKGVDGATGKNTYEQFSNIGMNPDGTFNMWERVLKFVGLTAIGGAAYEGIKSGVDTLTGAPVGRDGKTQGLTLGTGAGLVGVVFAAGTVMAAVAKSGDFKLTDHQGDASKPAATPPVPGKGPQTPVKS